MDWQHAVILLVGYLGQWLKSFKNIPTPVAQGVLSAIAVALYALQTPPSQPITAWLMSAVMWALAVLGAASAAAGLGIAPKTDSK